MRIDKDIQGVALKTWGAINKRFHAISKPSRVVLPVAAIAILVSCAGNKTPTMETTVVPSPTITATLIPTAIAYHVQEPEGTFTVQQEALNNSESALNQKARAQRWLDYWVKFKNRPFADELNEIHWKFVYDNAADPTEVMVLIEAGGQYGDKTFGVPINEGGFEEVPPVVSGETIQAGLGPLELSGGSAGLTLSVEAGTGIPVRRSANGQIIEKLNGATGEWDVVAIDQERFHKLPASYEAFLANPEAFIKSPVNPIDNPVEFKKWLDGPLSQALGDPSTREINVWGDAAYWPGYFELSMPKPEIVKGQPEFFWFQLKDGTKVPVILFNIGAIMSSEEDIAFNGTLAIALDGSEGNFNGTNILQAIAEGKPIDFIRIVTAEYSDYPNLLNQMVQAGFTGQENASQLRFGAGFMRAK